MTVDLDDRRTIETGRSWRDLPPSPPRHTRSVPEPVPIATAAERTRPVRRTVAIVLVLALLAGVAVGWWSPWSTDDGDVEAAPTTVAPEGVENLPDTIVPDVPDDLFTQPQPESDSDPFGFFDELPPFDEFPGVADDIALIRLGPLPDGYRTIGSLVSQSGEDIRHQIRLLGDEGLATIWAERDPAATLPDEGSPIGIGDVEGRLVEGSTNTVTWQLGDVVVTAHAPAEVSVDTLLAIAAAVEVVE